MTKRRRLIYVLAASHSGSTLTAMLLGAHPELACVGELKAVNLGSPDTYLCSCRNRVGECAFWSSIHRRMRDRGEAFSITDAGTDIRTGASAYERRLLRPLVRGPTLEGLRDLALFVSPGWRRNLPAIQSRNYQLIDAILEETGASAIVDSSKIGIRLKYLLRDPRLDVKVIWLVRDGRGVSLAYLCPHEYADASDEKFRGGGSAGFSEAGRDVEAGALEWKRANDEAFSIVSRLSPDRWIRVRYEDLCNDTERTLDRLFDFAGVNPDRKILDFRSVEHHVIGNGMRLDSHSGIRVDDRWKELLSNDQLERFYRAAGDMNTGLGYEYHDG